MNLKALNNVNKKDLPLEYRKIFTGDAVFETPLHQNLETGIEFSLEKNASGATDIRIKINDAIDYPLLPLIRTLKEHIRDLDMKGKLR